MSGDKQLVRIIDKNKVIYYKRVDETQRYKMIDEPDNIGEYYYGIAGNKKRNNILTVYGRIEINENENSQVELEDCEFLQEIKNAIINRRAVATTDVSMFGNFMATQWKITILEQEIDIEGGIESKTWSEGMVPVGEAI